MYGDSRNFLAADQAGYDLVPNLLFAGNGDNYMDMGMDEDGRTIVCCIVILL